MVGWLHQISVRLAIETYWLSRDQDDDIPFSAEDSWQSHGSKLWAAVQTHGIVPLPEDGTIYSLDPFRLCPENNRDSEYAAIRTLATFEIYDALENLCDDGVVWDIDEDSKPYLVSGCIEDLRDSDEHGEDIIERKALLHCLYDSFPGDEMFTTYVGIDLNVGDKELIDGFRKWLDDARSEFGYSHRQKTGLGPRRFATWSQFRILGYLDLTFWAQTQGFSYQQGEIARLFFGTASSANDETVRKTLVKHSKLLKQDYWSLRALAEATIKQK